LGVFQDADKLLKIVISVRKLYTAFLLPSIILKAKKHLTAIAQGEVKGESQGSPHLQPACGEDCKSLRENTVKSFKQRHDVMVTTQQQVRVHAACPCPCTTSIPHVHFPASCPCSCCTYSCTCCMIMPMLCSQAHPACPCSYPCCVSTDCSLPNFYFCSFL
jgi:hypothetical protein